MQSELVVENLDHLGIVVGMIDGLGLVEQINERLGQDPREKVSAGVVVKAMILNGLGSVSITDWGSGLSCLSSFWGSPHPLL